jgi:tRNA C32,U32 (ribose-2'-O)-methylase TrmJ
MNILTVIGFVVTMTGFLITIWQIYKTRKISNAAYLAASEAKSAIKNVIVISDLSTIVKLIQEIKTRIFI